MRNVFYRIAVVVSCYGRSVRHIDFNLRRNRFMRFLVAGGINTLFGFAVYSGAVVAGVAAWLALLVATVLGIAFNFITTGGYVFREISLVRLPRFVICYLVVYTINLGLIELLLMWLTNRILSQFVLMCPMTVLSYLLMTRFVYLKAAGGVDLS